MSDIREGTVADISDIDLLERAVKNVRSRDGRRGELHCRWSAVSDAFALGSTYSAQLCRRFGLDPNEMVKR